MASSFFMLPDALFTPLHAFKPLHAFTTFYRFSWLCPLYLYCFCLFVIKGFKTEQKYLYKAFKRYFCL